MNESFDLPESTSERRWKSVRERQEKELEEGRRVNANWAEKDRRILGFLGGPWQPGYYKKYPNRV